MFVPPSLVPSRQAPPEQSPTEVTSPPLAPAVDSSVQSRPEEVSV